MPTRDLSFLGVSRLCLFIICVYKMEKFLFPPVKWSEWLLWDDDATAHLIYDLSKHLPSLFMFSITSFKPIQQNMMFF